MITVQAYLIVSAFLFCLSLTGLIVKRHNVITVLMCIELMLLAVNTNFIAFANYWQQISGEIFVFFILTVAAAETAIGLAIIILLFRQRGTVDADQMKQLHG